VETYPKINSVFLRDPETKFKTFLSEYADPTFAYLADNVWEGTEKVDGTNIRISKDEIAGRTDKADIHKDLMVELLIIQSRLMESTLPDDAVLFGEGYGAGIQSGGNYRQDKAFVLFDVLISENWQERENVNGIADHLNLRSTPTIDLLTLDEWVDAISAERYVESLLHEGARNEGVVLRPTIELRNRWGERIITKLKFKDFQ